MSAEARMTPAEEREIIAAFERDKWAGEWNSLPTAIDNLLASRIVRAEKAEAQVALAREWAQRPRAQHPRFYVALHTRTRLIGTLNLAVALRGRSSGWGSRTRPRRTFLGFHRGNAAAYHRGIELVVRSDPKRDGGAEERTLLHIPLGSGATTWRFTRATPPRNGGDA